MSRLSTATINVPLTTYAYGLMQDRLALYALANLICPIVQVGPATGNYKIFDDRNAFLAEDMTRPMGGPRKRLTIDATNGTYNCAPFGVEIPVDDFELAAAGGGTQNPVAEELLTQGKMRSMISKKATGYAQRVTNFVFSNLTPVALRGNFSNPDIDPIDQLDEQLDGLATDTGTTENKNVIISVTDWRKIRSNALVKKRLGVQTGLVLTRQQLVDGLLYPVNLVISGVSATTVGRGQAALKAGDKKQIMAGYTLFVHTEPNATINDASAFKCFSTSNVLVDAVKTYREENANSDIHAMDWSEAITQTGPICARLLAVT